MIRRRGWIQVKRISALLIVLLGTASAVFAQQAPTSVPAQAQTAVQSAEFLQAADEVLCRYEQAAPSLPILTPLKKSLRSRDEIEEYLLRKMKEDKDAGKRYADQKTMEKFGLLPKDYPLQETLVKVLTEQIAGLYDPDSQEFFIADWNDPADQSMVMSHELTHALQDQHFHIDKWEDAAKPDDDAELARDAVLEGSAMAAMVDYILRGKGSVMDLPDIDASVLMGDVDTSSEFSKAPKIIQDELLFPYFAGAPFAQQLIKASKGWPGFYKVFENPPASTQQIMHPELYLQHVTPPHHDSARYQERPPGGMEKTFDENDMGEFGILEVFQTISR